MTDSRKGKTLLAGHTLMFEGERLRDPICPRCRGLDWLDRRNGPGHGGCSCGAYSNHVQTKAARKRWHAEHKERIRTLHESTNVYQPPGGDAE